MGTTHFIFGGTLLLMFGVDLFTSPNSVSASLFDRVRDSEPATVIRGVFGQLIPRPQNDQPQTDQQSTTPSTTTTAKAASEPSSIFDRVIGNFIPLPHLQSDSKPHQTATSFFTTTSSSTTSSATTPTAAPKPSVSPSSKNDGVQTTTEEGGSATVPPFVETCYLVKNDSGIIKSVNMSRAEAGNDTYLDYEEYCNGDTINTRISAGALASLAG